MSPEAEITRKLFRKYELDIHQFQEQSFLTHMGLFPCEFDSNETRVTLGKILTLDWLKDLYNEHDSLESYDEEYKSDLAKVKEKIKNKEYRRKVDEKAAVANIKKQREDFLSDLGKVGQTDETDQSLTFSIFCKNYDKHFSLKSESDLEYVYETAYNYMSFLVSTCPKVYKEIVEDIFSEDVETFKDVLEQTGVTINNDNIEYIKDVSYRLYKDSKFFMELEDFLGKGTYEQFIRDFEYIINEGAENVDFEEEVLNNVI